MALQVAAAGSPSQCGPSCKVIQTVQVTKNIFPLYRAPQGFTTCLTQLWRFCMPGIVKCGSLPQQIFALVVRVKWFDVTTPCSWDASSITERSGVALTLWTFVREVPGSNLSWDYPGQHVNWDTTTSFQILCSSSFIIPWHDVWKPE
jgi:hypothetical protein